MKTQHGDEQLCPLQGNKAATPLASRHTGTALEDRTNRASGPSLSSAAIRWKHPKDKSLIKPHSLTASHQQEATGNDPDESADRAENAQAAQDSGSAERHLPDGTSCSLQDVSRNDAPAGSVAARFGGTSCTQHDASVGPESEAVVLATGLVKVEGSGDGIQQLTVGRDSDTRLSVQGAMCNGTVANAHSTLGAVSTVSPGRRMFAAQVTITRPTTPASPASRGN